MSKELFWTDLLLAAMWFGVGYLMLNSEHWLGGICSVLMGLLLLLHAKGYLRKRL